MVEYDFHTLSYIEFENITQDLLQKELKIDLESFAVGKDGGIDLRHSRAKKGDLIVQCKHYKNFSSLYSNLKKEKANVKELSPSRYMLATSVPLTPVNVNKIKELFKPYIKSNKDIYGKSRLNNLLRKYPEVEESHYKLWLSSTRVLDRIVHSNVVNQSKLELQDIKNTLVTYVENESYSQALNLLQERHYVIISGLPGLGKTTLAQMLIYRLLGKGDFEELVYITGDIRKMYELYKEGKRQLFFFDDFLGRNFLEKKLERNEDGELIKFLKRVESSDQKALIMTTREYILNQAKNTYEHLQRPMVDEGKYVINLSQYTSLIKARILYNHLAATGLPEDYIKSFLDTKVYKTIIQHENYNPRLIETILESKPWLKCLPSDFPKILIQYFDNPESLWTPIYENEMSETSRVILKILFTATAPMILGDLEKASAVTLKHLGMSHSYTDIGKALKELEGTFTRSGMKDSSGKIIIDFQNPSVYDFLRYYYIDVRRNELLPILQSAIFLN